MRKLILLFCVLFLSCKSGTSLTVNKHDYLKPVDTIKRPTPMAWFSRQFSATGITYEISDGTPRDFIKVKGETSARAMMELLLNKTEKK